MKVLVKWDNEVCESWPAADIAEAKRIQAARELEYGQDPKFTGPFSPNITVEIEGKHE